MYNKFPFVELKKIPVIKNFLFKFTQGRWFYALLACLEKPLLPEAHSLIRQLARRCSEVRVLEVRFNVVQRTVST